MGDVYGSVSDSFQYINRPNLIGSCTRVYIVSPVHKELIMKISDYLTQLFDLTSDREASCKIVDLALTLSRKCVEKHGFIELTFTDGSGLVLSRTSIEASLNYIKKIS